MTDLLGKHIVLGLCGGIACYKSAELCRLLIKQGASVQVVMTQAAERFITPATMQALSGRAVLCSQWDASAAHDGMAHIHASRAADAILVAPATADFIAKLACGQADDLLSLLCLARPIQTAPLVLAPAMNREMWAHPATARNVATLRADGARVLEVGIGEQACGELGSGRMLEPHELIHELVRCVTPQVLARQRVLVSAGPTFEAIDPVRGLTNLSSGKMGFALARAAYEAGAQVTLVAGPVGLATPYGVQRVDVRSALEMQSALAPRVGHATVFIATAAVADWRVDAPAAHKIKKDGSGQALSLSLVQNPDLLAAIAASERAQSGELFCVGFAAETQDLLAHAQAKRQRKGVPLLVGNLGPEAFGQDDNALVLVDAHGTTELARAPKLHLARELVRQIAQRLPIKNT